MVSEKLGRGKRLHRVLYEVTRDRSDCRKMTYDNQRLHLLGSLGSSGSCKYVFHHLALNLHTLPTYIEGGISISVPASFTVLESSCLRYWLAQDLNLSSLGHCCRLTRALSPSQSLESSVSSAFYLHP